MINRSLKIILLFFMLGSCSLFSQSSIDIPDATADRYKTVLIPVYGSFVNAPADNIDIVLSFNARVIDIDAIFGSIDYYIKNSSVKYETDFSNLDKAKIRIKADSINSSSADNILCMLEVRGLSYEDSITYIVPEELYIDGVIESNLEADSGRIVVPGIPIIQGVNEGIGLNYPNPFSWKTHFKIVLEKKTTVKFKIFSALGRMVYSSDNMENDFRILFKKDNGSLEIIKNLENPLEPGSYELELTPTTWELTSGAYYMVLETEKEVYNTNFIYKK